MELVQYIRLFRRWFWLIFLFGFLAGSAAYIYSSRQESSYRATVTLFVGGFRSDPNPNSLDVYIGFELVETYAQLATTYDIADAAVENNNFPMTPGALRGSITTEVVELTSLLKLSVTYNDPDLAVEMANAVANQLILDSPANLTPEEEARIQIMRNQINFVDIQIRDTQEELDQINAQVGALPEGSDEVDQLTARRDTLIEQLNTSTANLAVLSNSIEELQRQSNRVEIVEEARSAAEIGTSTMRNTIMGVLIGMVLAFGLVLLIEYLNDTIRSPEEATSILKLPVLGTIFRFGRSQDDYARRLVTYLNPSAPVSEGYKALRTNLLFASRDTEDNGHNGKYAFIITSPGPEEGKSVTTANLAVAMATAGLRVLLVDADMRRPKLHQVFDLDNELGLTTLLFANPADELGGADESELSGKLRECVQNTSIPRLRVITSGFSPSNPTEILGSSLMRRWFQEFMASSNVDVVLFDTPPTLVVADSQVLAATIGAPVLLVLRAGQTRRGAALRAKEQLENLNIDILGVALNSISSEHSGYGYGYGGGYYYYYSSSPNQTASEAQRGWRRFLPWGSK